MGIAENNTTPETEREIFVRKMRVIWRDTFILEHQGDTNDRPEYHRDGLECVRALPPYVADTMLKAKRDKPEFLQAIDRVSRSVASGGYDDLVRFLFDPFYITNLRPSLQKHRCPPAKLTEGMIRGAVERADLAQAWVRVTPVLLLHRAGVGIMEYYAQIDAPVDDAPAEDDPARNKPLRKPEGYTTRDALELVRMGFQPQLLKVRSGWRDFIPEERDDWKFHHILPAEDGEISYVIASLREYSQVLAHNLCAVTHKEEKNQRRKRRKKRVAPVVIPQRPTGSTTVILLDIEPSPGKDLEAFVREYAYPLRGIGAMDNYYPERSKRIVERELNDNLSSDAEVAVYLLGNSELMMLGEQVPEIVESTRKRLRFADEENAIAYLYAHYTVLLEWIYMQDAILRLYIRQLDELAAASAVDRQEMIGTLHGALADMIQYQENITPFATRVEFLERARKFHKLDELGVRFERKQDLLLTYSSEYHDYREARAAEFLNWLVAVLTGGEVSNLILNATGITPDERPALYVAVTLASITLAIVVMLGLRRSRQQE